MLFFPIFTKKVSKKIFARLDNIIKIEKVEHIAENEEDGNDNWMIIALGNN